jgi:hypothetical protein
VLFESARKSEPSGQNLGGRNQPWLQSAVDLHLLGMKDKPILLVEGTQDQLFLRKVAPMFGVQIDSFNIVACSGRTTPLPVAIDILKASVPNQKIYTLLDPDFSVDTTQIPKFEELKNKADECWFWTLPSIESYLFVHHVMKCTPLHSGLELLRKPENLKRLATCYSNGFRTQNGDSDFLPMFERWNGALPIIQRNSGVTREDILEVAKVVHGHTWVELLAPKKPEEKEAPSQDAPPTTESLIAAITPDFADHCGDLLAPIMDRLKELCPQPSKSTDSLESFQKVHLV